MKVRVSPAVRKQQSRHSQTNLSNNMFRTMMLVKIKNEKAQQIPPTLLKFMILASP